MRKSSCSAGWTLTSWREGFDDSEKGGDCKVSVGSLGHVKKGTISSLLDIRIREQMKISLSASNPRSATIDTEVPSDCNISYSAVLGLNTRGLLLQL